MTRDRWFLPVMATLFFLAGYMICQSCRVYQSTASGAEVGKTGSVIVWADSKADRGRLLELSQGYTGHPIVVDCHETGKNESSLVEYKTSRKLNLHAPRRLWPKIVAVALRRPHDCDGSCKNLFHWVDLR